MDMQETREILLLLEHRDINKMDMFTSPPPTTCHYIRYDYKLSNRLRTITKTHYHQISTTLVNRQ